MSDTGNNKDVDEAWSVEPPKKTSRGRKALRRALILVIGLIMALMVMALTYDAYCIKKYWEINQNFGYGGVYCSRCGKSWEIGYIGGALPKPRPFAPGFLIRRYNDKVEARDRRLKVPDHDCVGKGHETDQDMDAGCATAGGE